MTQPVMLDSASREDESNLVDPKDPPKLWGSCRLTLAFLVFFAIFHEIMLRLNLSMALVCMLEASNNTSHQDYGKFDWDASDEANVIGAYFYGYCCTQIVGGWISKRFGEKVAIFSSMTCLAVTTLLIPTTARWDKWALFSNRFVQGTMAGVIIPVVYNCVGRWSSPREKASLMAVVNAGAPLGSILNYPMAALLCDSGVDGGWPMVFYVPGSTCLVWCLVYLFLASNTPETHPRMSVEEREYLAKHSCANLDGGSESKHLSVPWRSSLLSVPVHALWVTMVAAIWIYYVISLNIPIFVSELSDADIVMTGFLSSLPFIGMFLTNFSGLLSDVLANRFGWTTNFVRKSFNTVGMVGSSLLLVAVSYTPGGSLGPILVLTASASLLQLSFAAGYLMSLSDLVGPFAGILMGFTNTMAQTTGFIGPLVVAAMAPNGTHDEWQDVFLVAAAIGTFGGLVYLFLGSNTLQDWAKGGEGDKNVDQDSDDSLSDSENVVEFETISEGGGEKKTRF